jgi:hypothetical protein
MSKYHNVKQKTDGITFDSKREADYYHTLKIFKMAGEIIEIELQPKFILQPGFWKCKKCNIIWGEDELKRGTCTFCKTKMPKTSAITYSADFCVTYKDGHIEIIDVKGIETEAFKIKRKLFEFKHPHLSLKTIKKGE